MSNSERQARYRRRHAQELSAVKTQIAELAKWMNELQAKAGLEVRQLPEAQEQALTESEPTGAMVNRQAADTVIELHSGVQAALNALLIGDGLNRLEAMLRQIESRFADFRRTTKRVM